jgi:hypothetical protein
MSMLETSKERILQQFIDNRPLGMNIKEDMEDVEQELILMELEGINLDNVTVRDVLKRLGVLNGDW